MSVPNNKRKIGYSDEYIEEKKLKTNTNIDETICDIGKFLVYKNIIGVDQANSNIRILETTLNYLKNINNFSNSNICAFSNVPKGDNLERINFCHSQDEAVEIVRDISNIWGQQTNYSPRPVFYKYCDGNSLNEDISNLLMVNYADIFDSLYYTINWDRHLNYIQVSFVHENAENFKRLLECDVLDLHWKLCGIIREPHIYRTNI